MRIFMTTIVFAITLMFATTGLAGNDAEMTTETTETLTDEIPAVESAPPDAAIEGEETDASETATDDD